MGESSNRAAIVALLMVVAKSEMVGDREVPAWLLYALIPCLVFMEICDRMDKKGGE
jgi:hypothetical protein